MYYYSLQIKMGFKTNTKNKQKLVSQLVKKFTAVYNNPKDDKFV
jgi:hypothetical protein